MIELLLEIQSNIHRQKVQNRFKDMGIDFFYSNGEYRDTISILNEIVYALKILMLKKDGVVNNLPLLFTLFYLKN